MEHANHRRAASLRTLTGTSLLTAIVVVLTVVCNYVKIGPFSITLALAPIIIGAALYGVKVGSVLGGVFGVVVFVTGLFGMDGGTVMYLFSQNALATAAVCIVKGVAAGWVSGLIYRALEEKHRMTSVVLAGIVCPVVNTGLFIAGMCAWFLETLQLWADGQNLVYYLIFGLTGINFVVELAVNLLLSSCIVRIIHVGKRMGIE